MLWIALHLPHLPLQALRWSQPGLEAALPLAVAEAAGGQHRLLAVNRAAGALGLRAGQSVATALSLVSQLLVLPRDVAQEAAFVHRLALALGVLTPNLCTMDSGVLLEVQASLRLFGGVRPLLRRADSIARGCGAQPRRACAPSASAAWLLATSGARQRHSLRPARCTRQLDRVPPAALQALLPMTPSQMDLLQMLGLESLRALRALPRAGLRRRFGAALTSALDRAYGDTPDPRPWLAVPEHFTAPLELLQRADNAEVLVAAVEALLPSLRGWLQLRWRAATVLGLRLRHEHGRTPVPDTLLRLQLSEPSRDMAQLALLWRERLQRHALAAPVYALLLVLDDSVPHGGAPGDLLPMATGHGGHAALIDRLVARLGVEGVQRWEAVADHRPERAQRVAVGIAEMPGQAAVIAPRTPRAGPSIETSPRAASGPQVTAASRPIWLLDSPQPLACDAHGRPQHDGPLRLCSRAERIEAGWFDGALVCRDYQVAEGADHRLRWIYRERTHDGDARWFLHGWFG
jgi:protein ImuB